MFTPNNTFQNFLGQLILSFLIMSALALSNPLANMIGNDKENMKVQDQRIILILPIAVFSPLVLPTLSTKFGSRCHWIIEKVIVSIKLNIMWTQVFHENHLNWILSSLNETGIMQSFTRKTTYFEARSFIVAQKNGCSCEVVVGVGCTKFNKCSPSLLPVPSVNKKVFIQGK